MKLNQGKSCQTTHMNPSDFMIIVKDGFNQKSIYLERSFYSIGRDRDRDIHLSCQGVSRYHASLMWLNNSYLITDGEPGGGPSKNGVTINGKKIKSKILKSGDKITFCKGAYGEVKAFHFNEKPKKSIASEKTEIESINFIDFKKFNLKNNLTPDLNLMSEHPDLSIRTDSEGRIISFQNSIDKNLPKLSTKHLNKLISECFPVKFSLCILSHYREVEKTQSLETFEYSFTYKNQVLYCEIRISPNENGCQTIFIRNINERKAVEKQLLIKANHDDLTRLPNRNFFMEKTACSVILRQRDERYHFAVIFIDLDRFKIVNDSLGHLAGDRLLIEISSRLKDCLRPQDIVARLGGDEFGILLHDIQTIDDATEVAERIQEKISLPVVLEGREIFPSASIGIAFSNFVYNSVEEIIKDADIAMYQAKYSGRAKYAVFEPEQANQSLEFLRLDSALKRAIERQEFKLLYQPIFEFKTQKLIGLEALIRWSHPQEGLLEPSHFLKHAEDAGLTDLISQLTLQESFRQIKEWESHFGNDLPIFLSINISKCQFFNSDLINLLRNLIEQYQVNASNIKLEITEATLMEDIQIAINIARCLDNLGIKFLIDDFGTGYSSLNYLHDLPIDALKIDQSFISGIEIDGINAGVTIIQSIIGLAHNLGIEVIAEGIECARHVAWLKAFKCDYGQGFYFGKPMTTENVGCLIESNFRACIKAH